MKKTPHKLPWELHDPKPAPRNGVLDLSDAAPPPPEPAAPMPPAAPPPGMQL